MSSRHRWRSVEQTRPTCLPCRAACSAAPVCVFARRSKRHKLLAPSFQGIRPTCICAGRQRFPYPQKRSSFEQRRPYPNVPPPIFWNFFIETGPTSAVTAGLASIRCQCPRQIPRSSCASNLRRTPVSEFIIQHRSRIGWPIFPAASGTLGCINLDHIRPPVQIRPSERNGALAQALDQPGDGDLVYTSWSFGRHRCRPGDGRFCARLPSRGNALQNALESPPPHNRQLAIPAPAWTGPEIGASIKADWPAARAACNSRVTPPIRWCGRTKIAPSSIPAKAPFVAQANRPQIIHHCPRRKTRFPPPSAGGLWRFGPWTAMGSAPDVRAFSVGACYRTVTFDALLFCMSVARPFAPPFTTQSQKMRFLSCLSLSFQLRYCLWRNLSSRRTLVNASDIPRSVTWQWFFGGLIANCNAIGG